jgi:ribosome-associated heat shock protein Hsp15
MARAKPALERGKNGRHDTVPSVDDGAQSVRIDKWLWAARVFKTRSLATDACDGGKVHVNDQAAKPAKLVRLGDSIKVTLSEGRRRILKVVGIDDRRGSAQVAAKLFEDHSPPAPPRTRLAPPPYRPPGAGRPTKRERRTLDRLRGF